MDNFICSPKYQKIIENEGLPYLENNMEKGNLIINFIIEFPRYISRSVKTKLSSAFNEM